MASPIGYRERDDDFFGLHDNHPITTALTVLIGIFHSYKVAARRISRMKQRKRARRPRCVGSVALHDTGREANVYCSWRPRASKHEVLLTKWLIEAGKQLFGNTDDLLDWMKQIKRGINTNSQYRPDAEFKNLMIEWDMGTEKKKQVQAQAKRYRDCESIVLWVFQRKDVSRFNWITEVATENTLVMLAGDDHAYDKTGAAISLKELFQNL